MSIQSPVTGKYNTSVLFDLHIDKINSQYKNELGLDTKRFFAGLSSIQLVECNDTKYRFYHPLSIFGDDQFYQDLQKIDWYYPKDNWEQKTLVKIIPEGKAILEIGSGAGFFMKKLKNKNCTRLSGLELNSKAVEDAQKQGLDVVNERIEDFSKKNAGQFDIVIALQVLEHIPDIQPFINASLEVLKPGGRLIYCVPNNNPYYLKHDLYHTLNLPPHHSGLWNREAFSSLPKFFPMQLHKIRIETFTDYSVWYKAQVAHLKAKKNPFAGLLSLLPDKAAKLVLKPIRFLIDGRSIMVEYIKQ